MTASVREVFYGTLVRAPRKAAVDGALKCILKVRVGRRILTVLSSGSLAEIVLRFLKKGDGVGIESRRLSGGVLLLRKVVFKRPSFP